MYVRPCASDVCLVCTLKGPKLPVRDKHGRFQSKRACYVSPVILYIHPGESTRLKCVLLYVCLQFTAPIG